MEQQYLIDLKNISKIYKIYEKPAHRVKESINISGKKFHKDFYALKNIDLSVEKGETIGIIGKNGSGKSTLLKIISGVLSPSSGRLNVIGRVTSLLELGAGFNPEYTGIENIYLNGSILGYSKKEMDKKIPKILEFADIGDFSNKPVKMYSSGMFARLAFALVVNLDPEILIVDEALSVGDIFFQQKCNMYMKEEMGNVTKLLVTHDMSSIANLCDRAIVLSQGTVQFAGAPLDAIEYYIKSMHNEVFTNESSNVNDLTMSKDLDSSEFNWEFVEEEKLSGALGLMINAIKIKVNGEEYKGYIQGGDQVDFHLLFDSHKIGEDIIFGYIVSDKFGNNIFGENTITSNLPLFNSDNRKKYKVSFSIIWPEIKEGDYFVTFGIGEGNHELVHKIQCWAHNVFQFKNIHPNKTVHCLFNQKINNVNLIEFVK